MNQQQILATIKEFSKTLKHKLPRGFGKVGSVEKSAIYKDQAHFIQALTELGNEVRLVFVPNTTSDFRGFLKKLNFQVLTFYRKADDWVPLIITLDKKLRPEAMQLLPDGTTKIVPLDRDPTSYYGPNENEVSFLTAFPYRSVVSDSEGKALSPMGRLLNLLKGEGRDIAYLYVYAIAVGLVGLALPLGTQAIVGFISGGMWLNTVVLLIVLVMAALVISGALQVMQISMVEIIQRRVFAKTAFEFAYRIPRMNQEALQKQYTPELINRFFDVMTLQKGVPTLLIDLLTAAIQIIFSLVLLSFYHPLFVLFGFLLLSLLGVIFYLTGKKGQNTAIQESKFKYKTAFWLQELARNLKVFKLSGSSQMPIERINEEIDGYLVHRKRHFNVLIRQFSYVIAFKTLTTGGLLALGAFLVIDRQITLGQFVAAELIVIQVINSVEYIIRYMETIYDMLAAVDKIGHVVDVPLEDDRNQVLHQHADGTGIHIKTKDLSYQYPGSDKRVLSNIDLEIKPKDRVCITGYNGSGKSTLLRILDGSLPSYEGVVTLNDISLKSLDINEVRGRISENVSQEAIFEGSVIDNITLRTPAISYQQAKDALQAVEALNTINQLPKGMETQLVAEGKGLSTGLAHKIILARCMAKQPDLLILNDFFHFFSKTDQRRIIDQLTDSKYNWSLVFVSIDPVILSKCTKVVVLREGEKILDGSYREIQADPYFQQLVFDKEDGIA